MILAERPRVSRESMGLQFLFRSESYFLYLNQDKSIVTGLLDVAGLSESLLSIDCGNGTLF